MESLTREQLPEALKGPRVGLWQSVRYVLDPYSLYQEAAQKYGDPVLLPTAGNQWLVVTSHPEGVKEIFSADPEHFAVWVPEVLSPLLGPTSLLLVWGERHKRDRKLLMPPFHGARMRAYGQLMVDCTRRHAKKLSVGPVFPAQELTQAISLEVILRAVFGLQDPAKVEQFRQAIIAMIAPALGPITMLPFLRVAPLGQGPWAKFLRSRDALDALLYEQISERRAAGAEGEDILALLLSARDEQGVPLSDQELRDELMTLVLAGHETTATGLAWALYFLHRDRSLLLRLREELDSLGPAPEPEKIAVLPYLDAVCSEVLRLYPVVPDVVRLLQKPMTLRGHSLPAGVAVAASVIGVHRREDLYPSAEQFIPERFLERKYTPFEYIPFGGGARRCLGAAFATYEMKLVLATLLREHRFGLARDLVRPVRRGITVAPEAGVEVVYLGTRTVRENQKNNGVSVELRA